MRIIPFNFGSCKLLWAFMVSLSISFPIVAATQTAPLEAQADSGKRALAAKDYEQAFRIFNEGFQTSGREGTREWQVNFLFYMGLARQQQSETSPEKIRNLQESADYYQQMLNLQPTSGAAINNLAQIYSQIGQPQKSAELFEKVINLRDSLSDSRQAFYALNFADFLLSNGERKRAIEFYNRALKAQPENTRAHQSLMNTYLSGNQTEVLEAIPYLWGLIGNRLVIQAQESALNALKARQWPVEQKTELLTIVVVSLSKQFYDPRQFLETNTAKNLQELAQDESIGEGAGGILRLHQINEFGTNQFSWWARQGATWEPPKGMWPRDGFRMLIRSLGTWYQQAQDIKQAEAYYLLAANLLEEDPDPEAFLRLADLYIAIGDTVNLGRMVQRFIPTLFRGKEEAYRSSRLKKIYEYHRALGVIYAHIGRWGDSFTPTSAIFQIEHAQSVAEHLRWYSIEPRLVNFLAQGYETKEQAYSAFRIRLNAAEKYIEDGDKVSAKKVLEPIAEKGLPSDVSKLEKRRYLALLREVRK